MAALRALVMAPLVVESTVFGVLVTARLAPQSFSSGECEFLRQLSEHVALAAHQTQLYGALQHAYEELRQSQKTAVQQERLRAGANGQRHCPRYQQRHFAGVPVHRVAARDRARPERQCARQPRDHQARD
ncbi:GAF domain-containing protein [Massilia sp. H-1]|nr:GAF domain-containing protein [Massilia sp. H-1]